MFGYFLNCQAHGSYMIEIGVFLGYFGQWLGEDGYQTKVFNCISFPDLPKNGSCQPNISTIVERTLQKKASKDLGCVVDVHSTLIQSSASFFHQQITFRDLLRLFTSLTILHCVWTTEGWGWGARIRREGKKICRKDMKNTFESVGVTWEKPVEV